MQYIYMYHLEVKPLGLIVTMLLTRTIDSQTRHKKSHLEWLARVFQSPIVENITRTENRIWMSPSRSSLLSEV